MLLQPPLYGSDVAVLGALDLVAIDYAVGLRCHLPSLGIFSISVHQAGMGSGGEGIY